MARFWIEFTFYLSGRGFVLCGDVLEGIVKIGMHACLPIGSDTHRSFSISEINFGRRGDERQDVVGLLLSHDDDAELEWLRGLKLEDKTIDVIEVPARDKPET